MKKTAVLICAVFFICVAAACTEEKTPAVTSIAASAETGSGELIGDSWVSKDYCSIEELKAYYTTGRLDGPEEEMFYPVFADGREPEWIFPHLLSISVSPCMGYDYSGGRISVYYKPEQRPGQNSKTFKNIIDEVSKGKAVVNEKDNTATDGVNSYYIVDKIIVILSGWEKTPDFKLESFKAKRGPSERDKIITFCPYRAITSMDYIEGRHPSQRTKAIKEVNDLRILGDGLSGSTLMDLKWLENSIMTANEEYIKLFGKPAYIPEEEEDFFLKPKPAGNWRLKDKGCTGTSEGTVTFMFINDELPYKTWSESYVNQNEVWITIFKNNRTRVGYNENTFESILSLNQTLMSDFKDVMRIEGDRAYVNNQMIYFTVEGYVAYVYAPGQHAGPFCSKGINLEEMINTMTYDYFR